MNKELKEAIIEDIKMRGGKIYPSFAKSLFIIYSNKGEKLFRFTFWYRLKQQYKPYTPLGFISYFFYYVIYKNVFDVKMSEMKIGKGFHIEHDGNVYLNANSIGGHFWVFQGVTIGADKNGGIPIIGNDVTVYTNAVICGNIRIGNNCTIGANAFINKDLEDNSIVINQCQIIKRKQQVK